MGNSAGGQIDLKIKIFSGQAQSIQLFDFYSSQKQELVSNLQFPSIIAIQNQKLVYKSQQSSNAKQDEQAMYRIQRNNFRDIIFRQLFQRPQTNKQNLIWKVLGQGQQMQIHQGDILKIGKIKVVFKQIVSAKSKTIATTKTSLVSHRQQTQRLDNTSIVQVSEAKVVQGQCRLCFDNTETVANPLVSLCKCSGTVKFIHYQCLRDWLSNNIRKQRSPNCLSFSYLQPTCCQLCKQQINNEFMHEGQKYSLYQFEKIQPPYAIFENRIYDQQARKFRVSVFNISIPQNTQINIGRNPNSQVILRDISVSRNHCNLMHRQGALFIQDKKSKFGTLVCPRKGFQFDSINGLQLQFLSNIIRISQQKAFNNCCCAQNNSYFVEINKRLNDRSF